MHTLDGPASEAAAFCASASAARARGPVLAAAVPAAPERADAAAADLEAFVACGPLDLRSARMQQPAKIIAPMAMRAIARPHFAGVLNLHAQDTVNSIEQDCAAE
jgi:hypothetical protein